MKSYTEFPILLSSEEKAQKVVIFQFHILKMCPLNSGTDESSSLRQVGVQISTLCFICFSGGKKEK